MLARFAPTISPQSPLAYMNALPVRAAIAFGIALVVGQGPAVCDANVYDYVVDRVEADGNLVGPLDGTPDFVDEFDTGSLTNWTIFHPPSNAFESAGLLHLASPGSQFPIFGTTVQLDVTDLFGASNVVAAGQGDFDARAVFPVTSIATDHLIDFGLAPDLQAGSSADYGIALTNFGPDVAAALGVPTGYALMQGVYLLGSAQLTGVSISPSSITGPVVLGFHYDDATRRITARVSLDGGATFLTPLPPVAFFEQGGAAPLELGGGGASAPPGPTPPPPTPTPVLAPINIDHYLCYRARLAEGQPRFPTGVQHDLQDQFDSAPWTFNLKAIASLCNPAVKNGSALPNPNTHQEGYRIRAPLGSPRFVKSNHETFDQFDLRNLTITAPDSLLVPSSKVPGPGGAPFYNATDVDHYKCYKAKLQQGSPRFAPPPSPTVSDQFFTGGQTFEVKRVTKLCNPVSKDGSTINHPESHLVCYKVKLPRGAPRFIPQTVSTNNQIRPDVLLAAAVSELCLPALKDP